MPVHKFRPAAMAPNHDVRHNQLTQVFARCIMAEGLDGAECRSLPCISPRGRASLPVWPRLMQPRSPRARRPATTDLQPMAAAIRGKWRSGKRRSGADRPLAERRLTGPAPIARPTLQWDPHGCLLSLEAARARRASRLARQTR